MLVRSQSSVEPLWYEVNSFLFNVGRQRQLSLVRVGVLALVSFFLVVMSTGTSAIGNGFSWSAQSLPTGSSVTINLSSPMSTSVMSTGATHTQYDADSWNNATAVASAQSIMQSSLTFQNQHIMGWGADDPEPSKGTYNWSSLDERVQLMRATHAQMVLTLCCAPGWMRPTGYQDDWNNLAVAPDPSHLQDFVDLTVQVVQRYPDVKYFQVWNELKGMWSTDPGATPGIGTVQRWDYERYITLYNAVYDAVKKVRPDALIGGPYVVLDTYGNPARNPSPGPSYSGGTFDQRPLDVISYWLQYKHGADFLAVDSSSANTDGVWATNEFNAAQKFAAAVNWIRQQGNGGATLPIWWSEWYAGVPSNAPANLQYDNAVVATNAIVTLQSGVTVPLLWQPQGDSNGFSLPEGLWTDTRNSGGGKATPLATTFHYLKQYFGPGTQLYKVSTSNTTISVLASHQNTLIVNHLSSTQTLNVNGTAITLAPYAVLLTPTPSGGFVSTPPHR